MSVFGLQNLAAQSSTTKNSIKDGITANKDHIKLIAADEYQQMSPTVKAIINQDVNTIIYTVRWI